MSDYTDSNTESKGLWIFVSEFIAFDPAEQKIIEVNSQRILVACLDGQFYAVESQCTHVLFDLDDAPIEEGVITCPYHGAQFCLKTGAALRAPAVSGLKTYPVKVEDGKIFVWSNQTMS